jgi:hypothetical protein
MEQPIQTQAPKEPLVGWVLENLYRLFAYLFVASLLIAALFTFGNADSFATGVGAFFVVGGVYGIPGLILWLTITANLPPEWPRLRRRMIAVATGPIIQILILRWLILMGTRSWAILFGIVLPAGAGLVIRLRQRGNP